MNDMNNSTTCMLSKGFSVWEKLYAQLTFFTMGIIGTIGIVRVDWRWMLPYSAICWYGILGIIVRHINCPRCPHLHTYGDCLQLHPKLTKWLVKHRKTTPFSPLEKWLFYLIFLLIPTYPIYWLRSQPVLLIVFGLAASMWYLGQWLNFCKRCRVKECPFNRTQIASSG